MTLLALRRPSNRHFERSYGVVSDFVRWTVGPSMMQKSVSVPPLSMLMSMPMPGSSPRTCAALSAARDLREGCCECAGDVSLPGRVVMDEVRPDEADQQGQDDQREDHVDRHDGHQQQTHVGHELQSRQR